MLQLLVIDESKKFHTAIESVFKDEFSVRSIPPADLAAPGNVGTPGIVVYVGVGPVQEVRKKVALARRAWPGALTILLLPAISEAARLRGVSIPAHTTIFGRCSKKRLTEIVDDYKEVLRYAARADKEKAILYSLVEFTSNYIPCVYICHRQVLPLLMTLASNVGWDPERIRKLFTAYLLILSSLDRERLSSVMSGNDSSAETMRDIFEHVERAVLLLEVDDRTEEMAHSLRYVLKRYDGSGYPKDAVRGDDIPLPARMIRLSLDYHYLVQSGKSESEAVFILNQRGKRYDKRLFEVLKSLVGNAEETVQRAVYPLGLAPGMVVAEDVYGMVDGRRRKFLSGGEILTPKTIEFIQRHCDEFLDITEPIQIRENVEGAIGG
ncbi:MAG: HD domain-containing phosphohydrolase [Pseudodesulfovibrio sp.]|uniref:HD domain-containing phosphohydrolase n=1 Tax=Pseudodesulfovibrio sp. TaxID=2035812 RepID=UPI003D09EEB6